MTETVIQDVLFLYTLHLIDRARDVRILWEVFLNDGDFYITESRVTDTEAINDMLSVSPYKTRVSVGRKNEGWLISLTGVNYASPNFRDYPITMTVLFLPYFQHIDTIQAQYEGIFSWYNATEARPLSGAANTGMWLE